MPHNHQWQSRIKDVETEYRTMGQAANYFCQIVIDDPTILSSDLRPREVIMASAGLEATYLIRLFAEFETGLRQYWETIRSTSPRTADLLNGLAARCQIPQIPRNNAHSVRVYRNSLVHERADTPLAMPLATARHHLCYFLSYLPPQW